MNNYKTYKIMIITKFIQLYVKSSQKIHHKFLCRISHQLQQDHGYYIIFQQNSNGKQYFSYSNMISYVEKYQTKIQQYQYKIYFKIKLVDEWAVSGLVRLSNFIKLTYYNQQKHSKQINCMKRHSFFSIFVIACILFIVSIHCLGFDLANTQILSSKDSYRIQLKPIGEYPPFKISYARVPRSFIPTEKYLLAPKTESNTYQQHLISVVLSDRFGQQYKISLIFITNSKNMFMDMTIYDFNADPNALNLQNIDKQSSKNDSFLEARFRELRANMKLDNGPNLKFQDVFEAILGPNEIRDAFKSNNIPVLVKLISKIPQKNINCIQKIAYLKQVSAIGYDVLKQKYTNQQKIQKQYIEKNRNLVKSTGVSGTVRKLQTQNIVQQPQINKASQISTQALTVKSPSSQPSQKSSSSIGNLPSTSSLNQQSIKQLNSLQNQISRQKSAYIQSIQNLKQAYVQSNTMVKKLQQKNKIQIQTNIRLNKLNKNYQQQFDILNGLKIKLALMNPTQKQKYSPQIASLQKVAKLLQTEINKLKLVQLGQQEEILAISKESEQQNKKIKNLQALIDVNQKSLSNSNIKLYNLKQSIRASQIRPEITPLPALKTVSTLDSLEDMGIGITNLGAILEDNSPISVIVKDGYHLNVRTEGQVNSIIDSRRDILMLQQNIKYLDSIYDQIYYDCYNIKQVSAVPTSDVGLYIYSMPYTQFTKYLRSQYQQSRPKYLPVSNSSPEKIQLQRINVLTSIWTNKFSDALEEVPNKPNSSIGDNDPYKSVGCTAGDWLQGKSGVITLIKKNIIQVKMHKFQTSYVLLGACTRLEIMGLPEAGKMIFWRGTPIEKGLYDAFFVLIV